MKERGGAVLEQMLSRDLPQLRHAVDAAKESWGEGDMGAHNLADEVLNPYLERLLSTTPLPRGELMQVWEFVEALASHTESYFQEVAAVTVVENLLQDKRAFQIARGFMGPKTLLIAKEMEKA